MSLMGTRGAITFGDQRTWRGIYNHADSQPTWLGPRLWRAIVDARRTPGGLDALRTRLIDAGDLAALERGERAAEPLEMAHDTADPLHVEWVYVIDSGARRLHVLGHAPVPGRPPEQPLEYVYDRAASFDLDGAEPDWRACEQDHARRHAETTLAFVRARFGEDAYRSARRQILGE
jgi:hypothetical protein